MASRAIARSRALVDDSQFELFSFTPRAFEVVHPVRPDGEEALAQVPNENGREESDEHGTGSDAPADDSERTEEIRLPPAAEIDPVSEPELLRKSKELPNH